MQEAQLIEIFSSFQGEGPYVGQPMSFVRFQHCAFSCRYCDTPDSFKKFKDYRVEFPQGSGQFQNYPNPASIEEIAHWLQKFNNEIISFTGGEPLHHSRFLVEALPKLKNRNPSNRFLLETSGILYQELRPLIDEIDIVSMDIKLPSVTGMKAYWEEHRQFIKIANKKELYIKAVLGKETSQEEWQQAVQLVYDEAPEAPFILQPVTPRSQKDQTLSNVELKQYFSWAKDILPTVRVIPQMHVQAQWL